MSEHKAVSYGEVELIPGVRCDGYLLENGQAVMSERGVAKLLGMHHKSLQIVAANWPPKMLETFIHEDLTVAANPTSKTLETRACHHSKKFVPPLAGPPRSGEGGGFVESTPSPALR